MKSIAQLFQDCTGITLLEDQLSYLSSLFHNFQDEIDFSEFLEVFHYNFHYCYKLIFFYLKTNLTSNKDLKFWRWILSCINTIKSDKIFPDWNNK